MEKVGVIEFFCDLEIDVLSSNSFAVDQTLGCHI